MRTIMRHPTLVKFQEYERSMRAIAVKWCIIIWRWSFLLASAVKMNTPWSVERGFDEVVELDGPG
jgi:hypothetical protein